MEAKEVERYIGMYRGNVLSAALCCVKDPNDADDIMQDVFLGLYTYNGVFNSDEHVKAWLIRCTVNRSRDLLGSHWRRFSAPLEAAGDVAHYDKVGNDLFETLHKLGRNDRIVLYMHYYEGYSVAETAKILGISANAVSSRLSRGRRKLKKLLDNERNEIDDI